MENIKVTIENDETVIRIKNSVTLRKKFAEIVAETQNFENIGNDGQYEYGLKLIETKRPMKGVKVEKSISEMAEAIS